MIILVREPMAGQNARGASRGFTIIELLISIGLIGMLLSLLFPAVQSARETTRKITCANNLKLLALGCLQHESAHQHLPSGGWDWNWQGDPDRGFGRAQPGGWTYNVLPYIEQTELHNRGAGLGIAAKKKELALVGQTGLSIFYCPTRRRETTYANQYNTCNSNPIERSARTDYAGNAGTNAAVWYRNANSGDPTFFDAPGYQSPNFDRQCNGVFAPLSVISLDALVDSTSYTFLLGEKYLNPTNATNSLEASDNNPLYAGFDWDWQRWGYNSPIRDRYGFSDYYSFGSSHVAGVNMAMCDGAVRSIDFDIDATAFARLCGRADGVGDLPNN